MSKEAKIGLLLGLVFIVAIAIVLKGVHRNSNNETSEQLSIDGTVESPVETDLGNTEGLSLQQAARQFDDIFQPEIKELPVEINPANDINGPATNGESDITDNQSNFLNQAPSAVAPPWSQGVERFNGNLPGSEPVSTPGPSTENRIITIGSVESSAGQWNYVVKDGDMLWNIAEQQLGRGARWQEISRLNNLPSPDDIKIDQKLLMPARQSRTTSSPSSMQNPRPAAVNGGREYLVRKGDTLGSIASNQLGGYARWKEIQRLNNMSNEYVREGQKILLPGRQNSTNMSSSNTVTADSGLYQVQGGESLWKIARVKLGDGNRWREIMQLNNLPSENVQKGQKIKLPIR